MESVTGDFIENSAYATKTSTGGAISNISTLKVVRGDFIENTVTSLYSIDDEFFARGGAISNEGTMSSITGDFITNSISSFSTSQGGAVYNKKNVGTIMGNFIANSVSVSDSPSDSGYEYEQGAGSAQGGAVFNNETMGSITGNFITNSASSSVAAQGGAIYNSGNMALLAKEMSMVFTGNYVTTDGGINKRYEAIYNSGERATASLHFNSYAGASADEIYSIVVNDSISGHIDFRDRQNIHINSGFDGFGNSIVAEGKIFSVVAFNSAVDNQSITVHAGELRLGSYAGSGTEGSVGYARASEASLNNSSVTINAGARVSVQGELKLDDITPLFTPALWVKQRRVISRGSLLIAASAALASTSPIIAD